MTATLAAEARERLADLVREFPPLPIADEEQYQATRSVMEGMLDRTLDAAEDVFLFLLGCLIEDYEQRTEEAMPDISGVDMLRVLLRERGLSQRALVDGGVFPTESVASAVISGRRPLSLNHVLGAARYFGMSPAVFLPEPAQRAEVTG